MEDYSRPWVVWRCESVASGQVVHLVRHATASDLRDSHTYQRVIWEGVAMTADDAARRAGIEVWK